MEICLTSEHLDLLNNVYGECDTSADAIDGDKYTLQKKLTEVSTHAFPAPNHFTNTCHRLFQYSVMV